MEEIIWNEITQELLVEYVKCYPSLWDRRNVDFSRKDKNWRRWGKIGHFLDCSGEEAQHQFQLLKKRFLKYIEKLKTNNYKKFKPFFLAEKMGYLLCSESLEAITTPVNNPKLNKKDSFSSLNLEAIFAYSEGTNTQDDIITEIIPPVAEDAAVVVSTGGKKVPGHGLKASGQSGTGFGTPRRPPPNNFEEAISVYAEVLGGPYDDGACSSSDSTPKFRSTRNRKNHSFCTRNKFKKRKKISPV